MPDSNEPVVPGEVLSENDVKQLLSEVAVQENAGPAPKPSPSAPQVERGQATLHDFRKPVFLTSAELRKLRQSHEEFVRSLAARLSIYLRIEFSLQLSNIQTLTYQQYLDSLPSPAHVTLFKIEPLRGICLLDLHPRLGMTIVDRLLGGPANSAALTGELGEIDITLLDQAVSIMMHEWCNHWRELQELNPLLIGHENNSRFLQTSPPEAVMLVLSMDARLGDCEEKIQLAVPFYTLEKLVRRLTESVDAEDEAARVVKANAPRWDAAYDEVRVPVTAEWRGIELTAGALARLKPGDVVMMEARHNTEVHVRLASLAKFTGKPGTRGGNWAVQLSGVLPAQQRG